MPKPNVWLTEFGENGVEHEILVWISDPEGGVGNVRSDVLNRLWVLFKDHGIVIPYPAARRADRRRDRATMTDCCALATSLRRRDDPRSKNVVQRSEDRQH